MQVNVLSQSKFSAPTTLPIFGFQLRPDAPELLLARIGIEELRKTHPTPVVSNVKSVYMSPWVSHLINPKLGPLCRLAESLCSEAAKMHWNVDPKVVSFKVWNCWGAIYETADHTVSHSHFPSDLSCVAYLEAEKKLCAHCFRQSSPGESCSRCIYYFPKHTVSPRSKNQWKADDCCFEYA